MSSRHRQALVLPPADRSRALFLPALLVIGLATVAAGVAYRYGLGLTVDEPFMANMVRLPWRQLWGVFPIDNVPFAYVALRAWTTIFGESEFALRSLSAVAYGGAAIFTGLATRRVAGEVAGLTAAAFIGASDRIGLEHAATARPYALLALVAAAALWQSVSLLGRSDADPGRTAPRAAALWLTDLIGLLTHPTYVVVAATCAGSSLVVERRIRSSVFLAPAFALLAYSLFWGPVVAATVALRTTIWMRPPTAGDVQRAYTLLWGVGPGFILAGALLTAMLGNRKRISDTLRAPAVRWTVTAAAGAWAVAIGVSFWKPIFEATRTPMMLLPLTCATFSVVLARCGGRATALAVAAICVTAAGHRIATRSHDDPYPTRASLEALLGKLECGDMLIAPGVAVTSVEYYFRRLEAPSCIRLVAFPADFTTNFADWSGRLRQSARVSQLEAEAAEVARVGARRGRPIWLLHLSGWETQEATTMMEAALRRQTACGTREPLLGAFFDGVLRCDPGQGATARDPK